jgi:hypothetical protein
MDRPPPPPLPREPIVKWPETPIFDRVEAAIYLACAAALLAMLVAATFTAVF